jgi:hypothetical protein
MGWSVPQTNEARLLSEPGLLRLPEPRIVFQRWLRGGDTLRGQRLSVPLRSGWRRARGAAPRFQAPCGGVTYSGTANTSGGNNASRVENARWTFGANSANQEAALPQEARSYRSNGIVTRTVFAGPRASALRIGAETLKAHLPIDKSRTRKRTVRPPLHASCARSLKCCSTSARFRRRVASRRRSSPH